MRNLSPSANCTSVSAGRRIHSWSAWPSHTRELFRKHFQQRREVIDHRIRRERRADLANGFDDNRSSDLCEIASAKLSSEPLLGSVHVSPLLHITTYSAFFTPDEAGASVKISQCEIRRICEPGAA